MIEDIIYNIHVKVRKAQQSIQGVVEVGGKDNGSGKRDKKREKKSRQVRQGCVEPGTDIKKNNKSEN